MAVEMARSAYAGQPTRVDVFSRGGALLASVWVSFSHLTNSFTGHGPIGLSGTAYEYVIDGDHLEADPMQLVEGGLLIVDFPVMSFIGAYLCSHWQKPKPAETWRDRPPLL